MATIQHPTFPDVAQTVPDADVEQWTKAGWIHADGGSALPDGDPSLDWTADQLKTYAALHSIDLTGATKKDAILAAITSTQQ